MRDELTTSRRVHLLVDHDSSRTECMRPLTPTLDVVVGEEAFLDLVLPRLRCATCLARYRKRSRLLRVILDDGGAR